MRYFALSTLLMIFLLAGCGGKEAGDDSGADLAKESVTDQGTDNAAQRQRPKVLTEDNSSEGMDLEREMEPQEDQRMDLMSWYDRSFESFEKEYEGFTASDMHPVKNVGICRKITVAFPEGGKKDKPGILVCDLYGAYTPDKALDALGITVSGRTIDRSNKWCSYRTDDRRILILRTRFVKSDPDRTNQLLIQFAR